MTKEMVARLYGAEAVRRLEETFGASSWWTATEVALALRGLGRIGPAGEGLAMPGPGSNSAPSTSRNASGSSSHTRRVRTGGQGRREAEVTGGRAWRLALDGVLRGEVLAGRPLPGEAAGDVRRWEDGGLRKTVLVDPPGDGGEDEPWEEQRCRACGAPHGEGCPAWCEGE